MSTAVNAVGGARLNHLVTCPAVDGGVTRQRRPALRAKALAEGAKRFAGGAADLANAAASAVDRSGVGADKEAHTGGDRADEYWN